MQLTKSPYESSSDKLEDPYYVSSVNFVDTRYLHTLKINNPVWHNDNYTFQYIRVSLNHFFNVLKTKYSYSSIQNNNSLEDLLKTNPIATRYISGNGLFIVERPPFRNTVRFTPTKAAYSKNSTNFIEKEVWIPWQVYVVNVDIIQSKFDFRIFFNDKPLSSMDDIVYMPWLPNLFGNSGVCWGDDVGSISQEFLSYGSSISNRKIFDAFCSRYWNGGWNTDILPGSQSIPFFLNRNLELSDNNDQMIHQNYKDKSEINKMRNPYVKDYANALNMWSQYSLEHLLYMMPKYSPKHIKNPLSAHIATTSSSYFDHHSSEVQPTRLLEHYFANSHKFPSFAFDSDDSNKYIEVSFDSSELNVSEQYNLSNPPSQEEARNILSLAIDRWSIPDSSTSFPQQLTFDSQEEPF